MIDTRHVYVMYDAIAAKKHLEYQIEAVTDCIKWESHQGQAKPFQDGQR